MAPKNSAAMISAAEQHVLGCPLPASVVARTESMRRRVAMFISAAVGAEVGAGKEKPHGHYNDGMLALRYLYVLALVVWLGGMVVLGAIVAPTTFQVLQASAPGNGRELAGELFGTLLARFHYVAYIAGALLLVTLAAMALLGPRPRGFAARTAIAGVMLHVALNSGFVVLSTIDAIQGEVGGLPSRLSPDDPRRVRFDQLHVLSTRLMMVNILGALGLLYWEARSD
jgi:uncharacterized membrane protein